MTVPWLQFQVDASCLRLYVHAQPNAKTTGVVGLHGGALKVRIAAPATDDKANLALLVWLAAVLDLPRSTLRLKSGATSRRKVIEILPASPAVAARAAALAD